MPDDILLATPHGHLTRLEHEHADELQALLAANVAMGSLSHTIRTLVLLPEGDSRAGYQRQVPRDHPGSD